MSEREQYITMRGLDNWIKCYMITDNGLLELPPALIGQLGGHLQQRWIDLNKPYYDRSRPPVLESKP
jgi:hypothetical protein